MTSSLFGRTPKSSFKELLKLDTTTGGLTTTLTSTVDGLGVASPLKLSTTQVALNNQIWPTAAGTVGQFLKMGANNTMEWAAVTIPAVPYDIAGAILGAPAAGAVVFRFIAVRAFSIPAGMTGSLATAATAATAQTVLSFKKNGTQFGTLTFAAAGTTGTFAAASATSFAAGDVITLTAAGTKDATFGDCQFTVIGNLP